MNSNSTRWRLSCRAAAIIPLLAAPLLSAAPSPESDADRVLQHSGIRGGVVVHIGVGDGRLTAALHAGDNFTVHGLERDPGNVRLAREHIRSRGLYGAVSVERWSGGRLPYADNLINLLVLEPGNSVPQAEILRVLVPGGAACIRQGSNWQKLVKPRPASMDEWTHFLHDAGNNAVAHDPLVGPPRSLQWMGPPLWLRSHETPSGVQALVTGGGRVFYIFDEGLIGITDERLPDRWSLVCRDAFNGRLLWKRPLKAWGWREWGRERWEGKDWTALRAGRVALPNQNERRVVVQGDRLYATLSYQAPLSLLDAATGRTMATVPESEGTDEILAAEGVVVAVVRSRHAAAEKRRGQAAAGSDRVLAADGRTGKVLWRSQPLSVRPLGIAIDGGRVMLHAGSALVALDLHTGRELWRAAPEVKQVQTLVAHDGLLYLKGGVTLEVRDGATGKQVWKRKAYRDGGSAGVDLFIASGLVWPGMQSVDENGKPARKAANAVAIGFDPRTGAEKKKIFVPNLRSPEHHHRCYRNKATDRFIISSMEGAEFMDLRGDEHGQNNWVRGACKLGMMPANGLLYSPPDQCFCGPGGKLLGFDALSAAEPSPLLSPTAPERLTRGPAYGDRAGEIAGAADWPMFRHDPARHGSIATPPPDHLRLRWRRKLGKTLTQPVVVGDTLYVADSDAHTIYAIDRSSGSERWHFIAGGRIDSPPTIHQGRALFGARDGRVYCLRASDGALAWRFLAAPMDRRIGCFDQLESSWPVHGSVLVHDGVAYVAAGRSTYLDGGIRLYALDPISGKVLHTGLLRGPRRSIHGDRDLSFFVAGANADILCAEGGFLYMRQKKLTSELREVAVKELSNKGEADVGLHIFSTSSMLDDSWYNRTFWMYSKRWPGFQLANQAPKTGQLLVVDERVTYALRVYYRRNVHSPMFFPGKEGYMLFADKNTTEPQIVGEPGARPPLRWLPQSDYARGRGNDVRKLESPAFGLDKMIGYTRADPPLWTHWLPVRVRGMVKAGDKLVVAGPPDVFDPKDPYGPFEGRRGAQLVVLSAVDGKPLSRQEIDSPPVFDGLISARGQLFASLEDGSLICLAE